MKSNWILRTALVGMSLTLASFGVLGWAYAAGALDAPTTSLGAFIAGMHDKAGGLWILFLVACIGCVLAQIIAACAVVNFARLAKAPMVWRILACAFYSACVVFAAYSADRAGKFVLGSSHYAMYQAREEERKALQTEIAQHSATIQRASARLASNTADTVTSRLNEGRLTFQAETAVAQPRLLEARRELASKPPLPAERAAGPEDGVVFLIFLALALLEPWGYALAERGEVPKDAAARGRGAGTRPPKSAPAPVPSLGDKVVAFGKGAAKAAGTAAAGVIASLPFLASPAPAEAAQPVPLEPATTSTIEATADGSSEFGDRVDAETPTRKSRRPNPPRDLPLEVAIQRADECVAEIGVKKFSTHELARFAKARHQARGRREHADSQSSFARRLAWAAQNNLLPRDRAWVARYLAESAKRSHHPARRA